MNKIPPLGGVLFKVVVNEAQCEVFNNRLE